MEKEYRTVQIIRNGQWETAKLEDVRKDDVFRMFEKTGEPVKDLHNNTAFKATSDPYDIAGVLGVDIADGYKHPGD